MSLSRREFLHTLSLAAAAGLLPGAARAKSMVPYQLPFAGNVRLLHMTDTHAQLMPVYYREPSVNIGVGNAAGQPPHLTGENFLRYFGIEQGTRQAHAFTSLDYVGQALEFGKVGGFAHLKTLVDLLRAEAGEGNSLLLDGGDTWQGSGTALKTGGRDMIQACNLLGVDIMTGHWEFTYQDEAILANIAEFKGEFLCQNVFVKEDALFDYRFEDFPGFDDFSQRAFKPYTIRTVNNTRVAVIGQAFPYTPIANPSRFIPDWTFGIRESELQALIETVREREKADVVVLLSHNGMDVDLKLASRVTGLDVILGGHTHDGVPNAIQVSNPAGETLVTNAGSNGKFLGVMDLDVKDGRVRDYRYSLMPVFANMLKPDPEMSALIEDIRKPHLSWLEEPLATTDGLLYRRGNFNGSFDQLICDALNRQLDAEISLSPGFRWGTTVLPGRTITMEDILNQTCMTYPETYVREMTGADLKLVLEDVCDNLFNPDPYYQQGGDMVRVGGLQYRCDPTASMGSRIRDLTTAKGEALAASKTYKVAGWATVGSQSPGEAVWDVVANDLREMKTVEPIEVPNPLG